MPYRPKINDIVHKNNRQFIGVVKHNGKRNRVYQITGNLFGPTMNYLMDCGYDVRVVSGKVIVSRPEQMRSYRTE